mmetsp:Transcript_12326/g.34773  ORF Transcript_12326/g.34773 Transcript_12326/m.34773 type:complete len:143 (-) Transcript_12326:341-769(-)
MLARTGIWYSFFAFMNQENRVCLITRTAKHKTMIRHISLAHLDYSVFRLRDLHAHVNLSKANLRNADLQGVDMLTMDLEGAYLQGADLTWCHLGQLIDGHNRTITSVAMSPDGIVTASKDHLLRMWQTSTGTSKNNKGTLIR